MQINYPALRRIRRAAEKKTEGQLQFVYAIGDNRADGSIPRVLCVIVVFMSASYGSGGLKPTSVRASLTVVLFAQN